ncbi:hotdog domain-containing protein [Haloechinothrix aidingensis]|uniref:hotdog domain-containing protein n=1 Tax=Haloechinothrix aidingensis TaxID=2752311 RepID=UPI0031B61AC6
MEGSRTPGGGLPGASEAWVAAVTETAELAERRDAVTELGRRLRELTEAAVRTEVPTDVLRRVADEVAAATEELGRQQREISETAAVDDLIGGVRMYNPVIGEGHPIAPPIRFEIDGTFVEGRCTLGLAHEGPPSSSHGGMSALWLDQALGHAAAAADNRGVTTNLSVRYRKPVPLGVPLRIWADTVEVDGNRTVTQGGITTVAEPDVALVEAEARFLRLNGAQVRRMFPSMFSASGAAAGEGE